MDSIIDTVTSRLVSKALDLSVLQRAVIANNVANAETAGYTPLRLNFEQVFERLGTLVAANADDATLRAEIAELNAELAPVSDAGQKVLLDDEMVRLTKNAVHYEALLTANSKLSALLRLAIKGESS
jgi:flagellar basal-body rod protein FlgB